MAILHQGGLLTGRMGDKVYYIKDGKQMVRSAHANNTNPRTPKQMQQRMLMKAAQERVSKLLEEARTQVNYEYHEAQGMLNRKKYSSVYTWLIAREMTALRAEEPQEVVACTCGDRQEIVGR